MSIGSSIGSVLKLDVKNVSEKPIDSLTISYQSPESADTGSGGWQPEPLLQPGQSHTLGLSPDGKDRVTFSADFVQFADGDVWDAAPPRVTVKPEGVRAGDQASYEYLLTTLERGGAAVLGVLPEIRVRIESPEFSTHEAYGYFGSYCGITKIVVQVEQA